MKNTLLFLCLIICHAVGTSAQTPGSQVTVQDDAKVGLIVTGTGNTINTTQIFDFCITPLLVMSQRSEDIYTSQAARNVLSKISKEVWLV